MIEQLEKNIAEIIGYSREHPKALQRFRKEILTQGRVVKKNHPCLMHLIEIILEEGQAHTQPIAASYLFNRAEPRAETPGEEDFGEIMNHVRSPGPKAESERETLWRIQERIIENIGLIPSSQTDPLLKARDGINRAKIALDVQKTNNGEITQPFKGLDEGLNIENTSLPRRPTGIHILDNGCLQGGQVTGTSAIISGIINVGKTQFTLAFLKADAFLGGTPLYVSCEDGEKLVKLRLMAGFLEVEPSVVEKMTDEEVSQSIRKKFQQEPHKLAGISRLLIWCPNEPPTATEICDKINEFESKGIIITKFAVDYIQNINVQDQPYTNRADQLAGAANQLYKYGENTGKNPIIVSQAKSDAAEKSGDFLSIKDALGDSFAVGRNAHLIITLKTTKEEETRRVLEKDARYRINLGVVKNKFGPKDGLYAIFNGSKSRWQIADTKNEREDIWRR